jgi:phosphotransferase system HPr (HPr) family protein
MKTAQVVVAWPDGLHARPATRLVRLIQTYRSRIVLRTARAVADGRSILSILMLCATMNTVLEVQAEGEDEELALRAVRGLFLDPDGQGDLGADPAPESSPAGRRAK